MAPADARVVELQREGARIVTEAALPHVQGPLTPFVQRRTVAVEPPATEGGFSDLERLERALAAAGAPRAATSRLAALRPEARRLVEVQDLAGGAPPL